MDSKELKLECLRLAVTCGSSQTAARPEEVAERYYRFVTGRVATSGDRNASGGRTRKTS